ncbi:BrnA antitoxin family protein [Rhizobium rhizosphaerae]|nr:BrnA antitoxin family protein [Xaviernesmea rhizosphaerae]
MSESRKSFPMQNEIRPPLTDAVGEVREVTAEDLSDAQPMQGSFADIAQALERSRGQRGPQKAPVKERVGLRLDKDVIEHFRKTGPGWQSRINAVLADYVKTGQQ